MIEYAHMELIATFPHYVDNSNFKMLLITKHMMILELYNVCLRIF